MAKGVEVTIFNQVGSWVEIYFGDHGGWVNASYLKIQNESSSISNSSSKATNNVSSKANSDFIGGGFTSVSSSGNGNSSYSYLSNAYIKATPTTGEKIKGYLAKGFETIDNWGNAIMMGDPIPNGSLGPASYLDNAFGVAMNGIGKAGKFITKADDVVKYADDIVKDGSELVLKGTNYSAEYAQKLKNTYKVFQGSGYEIGEHGLNRIFGRINQGKIESVDQVFDVLKTGTKYTDTVEGGTVIFKNGVSIHIAEDGFIKSVIGEAKVKSTWEIIK